MNLDDEIVLAAKAKMRMSGKSMGRVISEWARAGMSQKNQTSGRKSSRFPTFKVKRGSSMIPSDRASELLDDEV